MWASTRLILSYANNVIECPARERERESLYDVTGTNDEEFNEQQLINYWTLMDLVMIVYLCVFVFVSANERGNKDVFYY